MDLEDAFQALPAVWNQFNQNENRLAEKEFAKGVPVDPLIVVKVTLEGIEEVKFGRILSVMLGFQLTGLSIQCKRIPGKDIVMFLVEDTDAGMKHLIQMPFATEEEIKLHHTRIMS